MLKKVVGVLLIAIVISVFLISLNEREFDPTDWNNEPTLRYKMSKDIIENERFIGKRKDEIIQLLGEPEVSNLEGKEHLMYSLGKAPSFFESNDERLIILFDNSVVTKIIHSKD